MSTRIHCDTCDATIPALNLRYRVTSYRPGCRRGAGELCATCWATALIHLQTLHNETKGATK